MPTKLKPTRRTGGWGIPIPFLLPREAVKERVSIGPGKGPERPGRAPAYSLGFQPQVRHIIIDSPEGAKERPQRMRLKLKPLRTFANISRGENHARSIYRRRQNRAPVRFLVLIPPLMPRRSLPAAGS
jgi:hypothetical protein